MATTPKKDALIFRMTAEQKKEFLDKCEAVDTPYSAVLRKLVKAWMDDEIAFKI